MRIELASGIPRSPKPVTGSVKQGRQTPATLNHLPPGVRDWENQPVIFDCVEWVLGLRRWTIKERAAQRPSSACRTARCRSFPR
ncbi:hypothetical protein XFF6992_450008 [Xanthomonas citri pv. fuscans]|nr:hypothetical protein XFF6992_450008 [Xanthomonas citri pv. fuscans]SOO33966.1 hypothetical protein XFF6994_3310007 [Xanthomonas citri pv. fuscans]